LKWSLLINAASHKQYT